MKKKDNSVLNKILISMIIGGGAAFLFFVFYIIIYPDFTFNLQQAAGLIFLMSIISGTVTAGGIFLDKFLAKKGMTDNKIQRLIIFTSSIIIVGGVSFLISIYFNSFKIGPIFLICILGSFTVASITMIIDYYIWKMRKKVLALEIENKYLEEIAEKEKLLKETRKNLIVSQERNRIARELHDSISQGLHGIKYCIHTLRQKIENTDGAVKTAAIIDHLEKTTEETLKELRNMIFALKPSNLEEKGLARALKAHCELFAVRKEINFNIDIDDVKSLTPEQEVAIYRIVQEALTNVQKHSDASKVNVVLKEYNDKVKLVIQDNGKGFSEKDSSGNGLNNMKTRAFQNNGKINITSKKGKGTVIQAEFYVIE